MALVNRESPKEPGSSLGERLSMAAPKGSTEDQQHFGNLNAICADIDEKARAAAK
jgi:hypothetical protein